MQAHRLLSGKCVTKGMFPASLFVLVIGYLYNNSNKELCKEIFFSQAIASIFL